MAYAKRLTTLWSTLRAFAVFAVIPFLREEMLPVQAIIFRIG
jgi:hypothetical protein